MLRLFGRFVGVVAVSFFLLLAVPVVTVAAVFPFPAAVEAGQAFLFQQVYRFLGGFTVCLFCQAVGLDAALVQPYYFKGASAADGHQVGWDALVGGVGHLVAQDISFEEVEYAVFGLQFHLFGGQAFLCFHVAVRLVVQAALQFGALSGKFLRIQRDVLEAGGTGGYRYERGHPRGATQLASARTDAADASGFLTGSDLLHLDAHMEGFGKYLDELSEVHTSVGNVVEDCLVAVSLVFHIAYLHIQVEAQSYLAGTNHGGVLACLRFVVFLHIHRLCLAVDALDVGFRFDAGFLHLQRHEASGQCHHADVMSGSGFHGNNISLFQGYLVAVAVVSLPGVFELDLHQVAFFHVARYVGKPVVGVQLLVLSVAALAAEVSASVM